MLCLRPILSNIKTAALREKISITLFTSVGDERERTSKLLKFSINMVLSFNEYECARRSENTEIRELFDARGKIRSFYGQCCIDRKIQTLFGKPWSTEYSYNNHIVHSPVSLQSIL